jgi:hypothetical protein
MSKRLGLLVATVVAGIALAGAARADRLDNQLNSQMDDIVAGLKKKYKNVGVLRFRVQEGSRKENFDSPLSGRMAERVSTLLMIHNGPDEAKALGLVRDVSKVATSARIGAWYSNPAERRKLFAQQYPMAWGSKTVTPDAFVTGKVTLSKDRKKTIVTLEAFDRTAPADLRKLGTITLNTDRFVLRDLGYSFALSKRGRDRLTVKRSSLREEDENFVEEVNQQQPPQDDKGKPSVKQPGDAQAQPGNIGGIAMELLVKDKPASIRPAATQGDAIKWQVDSPPAGSEVAIRLRNNSGKRLAVVLRLNGVSTINEQKDDPENAAKWVIPPGRSYLIRGFYMLETEGNAEKRGKVIKRSDTPLVIKEEDPQKEKEKQKQEDQPKQPTKNGPKLKRFSVLVGEEAKTAIAEMGEKKGLIEVDVFEEGPEKDGEMLISPKGIIPSKEKQARSSYLGLRSALLKSSKLTSTVETKKEGPLVVRREVIVPDKTVLEAEEKLRLTEFANARLLSRITIKVMPGDTQTTDQ